MKASKLIITLLFILGILLCMSSVQGGWPKNNKLDRLDREKKANNDEVDMAGDLIEENPDYVELSTVEDADEDGDAKSEYDDNDDNDGDDDDDDGGDDTDTKVANTTVKEQIAKAMAKSRKKYRTTLKFVKKHRARITIALAIFAFRKEIRTVLVHIIKKEIMDPKTGKLRVSPTTTLKFILFVDFMRRIQREGDDSHPSMQALAALGQSNPMVGAFFTKVLKIPMYNPAYIPPITQHYTFERINERYMKDGMALHKAIHAKHDGFKWPSSDSSITRSISPDILPKLEDSNNETVIVLDLTKLDSSFSSMEQVRDEVSFLLSQYRKAGMMDKDDSNKTSVSNSTEKQVIPDLEIVVLLESPGGSAADYGLGAQQLLRLRNEPGIKLTICIDKVAASGGYMLACTASPGQLFAAPFAVVGSIGVLGQLVNVHNLLEGWGISPLVFRGGKGKAPIGIIGKVTEDGKDKVQSMIDDVHRAFKRMVVSARPILGKTIEKVGNGDTWIGYDALDLDLVDKIMTSDEYIQEKVFAGARVLKLVKNQRNRFPFGRAHDSSFSEAQSNSLFSIVTKSLAKATDFLGVGPAVASFRQPTSASCVFDKKISMH